MSYNTLLDFYFSSFGISLGFPLLLLILWYVFRKKILKGREQTFREVVIIYGIVFVLWMTAGLVNPLYWGYGAPEAVREIRYTDDKLLVIDHIRTMGGEGDEGTPCSRVHVIDPKTGEKQLRFTLGEEADLVGLHGDTLVVVKYNEAVAYSMTDGHEFVTYSIETLPELFPELSSGIYNLMWGDEYSVMEITTNSSIRYNLYLKSGLLYPEENMHQSAPFQPSHMWLYHTEDEIRWADPGYNSPFRSLESINSNQYENYLVNSNDSVLNWNMTFLNGEFVGVNNKDSTCIILSYETLQQEQFILTCVRLDAKEVMWRIHQSEYNTKFKFTDYWKPHTGFNEETNNLTFWIGSTVYCVDASTGKLLWETEL